MSKKTFKVLSGRSPTLQGCIQKFCQGRGGGGRIWDMEKKMGGGGGAEADNSIV